MASVERLPSGRWRGVYRDSAGRKQRVKGTFGRKTDAREAATEAEVRARRAAGASAGSTSARTTWGQWWDALASGSDRPTATAIVERRAVERHIRPRWGDVPLREIDHRSLQRWVDELVDAGHEPSYVRRLYGILRRTVRTAVRRDVLTADPCTSVRLPRVPRRPRVAVEDGPLERVLDELAQPWRDLFAFMYDTGLRPGEATGLHVHRVDLDRGWLAAVDVYVRERDVIRPYPKDNDVREVPLPARAVEIVRRRLEGRDTTRPCPVPHDGADCRAPLVFVDDDGRPATSKRLAHVLAKACRRAQVDHLTPYAARRGYASRLAEAGLDAFTIAQLMGHADVAQTTGYVQRTSSARSRVLAALGDPVRPHVVERGTAWDTRGTDHRDQVGHDGSLRDAVEGL